MKPLIARLGISGQALRHFGAGACTIGRSTCKFTQYTFAFPAVRALPSILTFFFTFIGRRAFIQVFVRFVSGTIKQFSVSLMISKILSKSKGNQTKPLYNSVRYVMYSS